jgi:acyl-CoA thioester hydrolase
MARIKLDLPEKFIFSTELTIQIADINYGGHLANDKILALAHEARIRFLRSHNYTEKNVEGLGLIMTDAAIIYKAEAFHGDHLKIELAMEDIGRIGFDLVYRMTNIDEGKEIARLKTGMAFFNYESRKISPTPPAFAKKFSA